MLMISYWRTICTSSGFVPSQVCDEIILYQPWKLKISKPVFKLSFLFIFCSDNELQPHSNRAIDQRR